LPTLLAVRARGWMKNLSSPGYLAYVFERIGARIGQKAADAGHALLRLAAASCGIGSWGGRRPSRAGDVTVTGAMDGATAAGGG